MRAYITSLFVVLTVSAIASHMMPEGQSKRGVRFALSLFVLLTVLSPLGGGALDELFSAFEDMTVSGEASSDGQAFFLQSEEAAMEAALAAALAERFSLSADEVTTDAVLSVNAEGKDGAREVSLRALTVHLFGRGCLADASGMAAYIRSNLKIDAEVVYHK